MRVFFFLLSKWALAAAASTAPNSFKERESEGERVGREGERVGREEERVGREEER